MIVMHRKSERKLESDYGWHSCLVKKLPVLQSAGNHRTLEIRQRCKKVAKETKGSKQGNRVNGRREKMERHLEKH